MVTAERFAKGMTFDQYCAFVGTPDSLKREGSFNLPRKDYSGFLRQAYAAIQFSPAQQEALTWVSAQPGGPARVLVISEEWSSDCRRDVPVLARMADVAGWQLRIFTRDGQRGPRPRRSHRH